MRDDTPETSSPAQEFDDSLFPEDTLFHERREGIERRSKFATRRGPGRPAKAGAEDPIPAPRAKPERRVKKERRRRIDPTTFEKQYTEDELEFMNAMQQFKVQSCKTFPSHGEVLDVARSLGYRKWTDEGTPALDEEPDEEAADSPASFELGIALPGGRGA
jgi:hypothetical protein